MRRVSSRSLTLRVSGSLNADGAAEDVAAGRAGRLPLGHAPQQVEVAVEVDAVAAGARVVAPVLAPHVVDGHDVLAAVRVQARQQPEVERLEDQPDVVRRPRPAAVDDVGAVDVAHQQVDGELDDGVRVHQLARVRAADDQHAAPVLAPAGAHPQRVDRASLDRGVRQLDPREVLRERRGQRGRSASRAGRSCDTSGALPPLDAPGLLIEPRAGARRRPGRAQGPGAGPAARARGGPRSPSRPAAPHRRA